MDDWRHGGFGLYLHWPFCASKCPYCDFNSHVAASIDEDRWKRAYLGEISRIASETRGRILNSIFFGGGTPSLMSPDLVADLISEIRRNWPTANDLEITLEANPGSADAGRFRGYAEAGVDRLSMGVQALNDDDLRRLGRMHDRAQALAAFDLARGAFDRVSFDLIYARQHQGLDAWATELREALSLAVDHLSLYQLTIEDGTVFAARHAAGHLKGLPEEDTSADMYELTQQICAKAGLPAYEISNHARPGAEARHNLVYWRSGDYAGIGPGAHGRLTLNGVRYATSTPRNPEIWLRGVERNGTAEMREPLSSEERTVEYLLMGLRIAEGVDLGRLGRMAPEGFVLDTADLERNGFVEREAERLWVTARGRPLLNAILRDLIA